jgi:hypothetical protein
VITGVEPPIAAATTTVTVEVAVCPPEVAVTTYGADVAVTVGVPEITPVVELMPKPAGSAGEIVYTGVVKFAGVNA